MGTTGNNYSRPERSDLTVILSFSPMCKRNYSGTKRFLNFVQDEIDLIELVVTLTIVEGSRSCTQQRNIMSTLHEYDPLLEKEIEYTVSQILQFSNSQNRYHEEAQLRFAMLYLSVILPYIFLIFVIICHVEVFMNNDVTGRLTCLRLVQLIL